MNSRDGDKKQLPVVLPPVADELLSSWIARHGAFYNVSPRAMLRHAVPSARSLRAADDHLTAASLASLMTWNLSNVISAFSKFALIPASNAAPMSMLASVTASRLPACASRKSANSFTVAASLTRSPTPLAAASTPKPVLRTSTGVRSAAIARSSDC